MWPLPETPIQAIEDFDERIIAESLVRHESRVAGVSRATLQALLLKAIYRGGVDSLPGLSQTLKLPSHVIGTLIEEAIDQKLLKVTGATARITLPVLTYSLTPSGRSAAIEALEKNGYIGPAPVSLSAYSERAKNQKLAHAREALGALVEIGRALEGDGDE